MWNNKSVIQWFYMVNILLIAFFFFFFSFTPLGALGKKSQLANHCHIIYANKGVHLEDW